MSFDIEVREGWLWPKSDTELWKVARDYTILEMALVHCTQRRVAIQAGGACGTFPNWLSQYFETVYTFEPDPVNFTCLAANCQQANVIKMQAALSTGKGCAEMEAVEGNSGAGYIRPAGLRPMGMPTVEFDAMFLIDNVDLIQLDVEGMEALALRGCLETIKRDHPVIAIEDKGHHTRYTSFGGAEYLKSLGYTEVGSYRRDRIFTHAL